MAEDTTTPQDDAPATDKPAEEAGEKVADSTDQPKGQEGNEEGDATGSDDE